MFGGVGDWSSQEFTEDQTKFLLELNELREKLATSEVEYCRLTRTLLEQPTPENQANRAEFFSMFIEPVRIQMDDVTNRLVVTAVDREKLNGIMKQFGPMLKTRLTGQLVGMVMGAVITGDLSSLTKKFKEGVKLDPDMLNRFIDDNLKEIAPMFLASALTAVNVPIMLEIAEVRGLPVSTAKVAEMIDKLLSQGVPRGR